MSTVAKKRKALPIPRDFVLTPEACSELRLTRFNALYPLAVQYAKDHSIQPASSDAYRICALTIDGQIDFCQPSGSLYVGGAEVDMSRTCLWKLANLDRITTIVNTLDTHTAFQIFFVPFLVDQQGNHPGYHTMISVEDVQKGRWRVDPAAAYAITGRPGTYMAIQKHLEHYVATLAAQGRYVLIDWTFHTMLGTPGHALVPVMADVDFFHAIARGSQTQIEIKGGNPLAENYSPFELEVSTYEDGRPLGQKNTKLLETLVNHDAVLIFGQAKSHCVAWAIDSILNYILAKDKSLAKKIYLVEDCTSPVVIPGVVDFTQQADEAFDRFKKAGMNVVQSTTPLEDYLPI